MFLSPALDRAPLNAVKEQVLDGQGLFDCEVRHARLVCGRDDLVVLG